MINPEIHERFMRDSLPVRIGGIAADLARIASFSSGSGSADVVYGLLNESRAFIEWTAPEMPIDDAAQLVDIQRGLTHWRFAWDQVQNDPEQRHRLAEQAQAWSDQVLAMSGLLDEDQAPSN